LKQKLHLKNKTRQEIQSKLRILFQSVAECNPKTIFAVISLSIN